MSKAIPTLNAGISATAAARGKGKFAGREETGGFSRLLAAGQKEQAGATEMQTVPPGGKKLPHEPHQRAAAKDTAQDAAVADSAPGSEQAAAGQDAESAAVPETVATEQAQSAEVPVLQAPAPMLVEVAENPAATGDMAALATTAVASVAAGAGVDAPAAQPATADGGVAAESAATATADEPELVAAGAAGVPAAGTALAQPQDITGDAQADADAAEAAPPRPASEPAGVAVRAGVPQLPAVATAQGNGADAGMSGDNGSNAAPEQPAGNAAVAPAAATISFADSLLDTATTPSASRISVPVGQPGWGRAMAEQVVWFANQNIHSASLKLSPQHLGPLELQLHMDGERASIVFSSQHAAVRDALESSLPRLRDMFAEQGLNLVNVNISHQEGGSGQDQAAGTQGGVGYNPVADADGQQPLASGQTASPVARGLVDCFA
ncbi:MAG: flagellar hook-length control protein FliK [Pseudomonadota bacterium]